MVLNPYKILPLLPREPLTPNIDMSPAWRLYLEQLQQVLGNPAGLDWQVLDKSGASLEDIGKRLHSSLQEVKGEGDLHVSQSQVDRWDTMGGSNVLTWLMGG